MAEPLLIIGSYLSPYVRKVLVLLELKGIAYRIDPIVPFFGDEAFERLSPLRQIPVLVDGDFVLNDSSVICQYLEERYPQPSLYPADIGQRAQARWLEEYADSRLGQVIIWQLFHQLVINRGIWQREPDQAILQRTYDEDLPSICNYLEGRIPPSGWLCGELSIADVAVACLFRNAQLARYQVDGERWPRLATLSPCRPSSIWRVSRRPPRRPRSPNSARRCARPARRSARPATPASGRCAVR